MKSLAFEFRMVKFNEIHPDSKNIRTKHIPDEDHALKQSILANGLIQPFIVCNNPNGSGYLIVDGHRTHDACREIFKESNPEVPVVVSSGEDGEFTEAQLRKARLLRDIHTQKLGDWDQLVAIKLHADDMREEHPDIKDKEIAESLGRTKSWLSKKLTAVNSGTFAPAIQMGKVSYGKSLIIKSAPVEAQERLIDATEGFTLHDTERVVKQVSMGVRIDEALRAVKTSKVEAPEIPQGTEEDALTVHEGEGETTEEAVEKDDDSGREPLQPSSPETPEIMTRAFERGGENGTEDPVPPQLPQSPLPEEGIAPDVPSPEIEKKKEPQVCAKVSNMEEMLQKLVNKPPKTFLATFKTASHKGNFKNRIDGIHLWSGELSDRMESDLNGDSLFVCEVKRKRKALMELLKRPKHSITESERNKFGDLMNELKTKIEQDAKRGG